MHGQSRQLLMAAACLSPPRRIDFARWGIAPAGTQLTPNRDDSDLSAFYRGFACGAKGNRTPPMTRKMPVYLHVRSVSFLFSPVRYLRFCSQVLTASRLLATSPFKLARSLSVFRELEIRVGETGLRRRRSLLAALLPPPRRRRQARDLTCGNAEGVDGINTFRTIVPVGRQADGGAVIRAFVTPHWPGAFWSSTTVNLICASI